MTKLTANQLYNILNSSNLGSYKGVITLNLAGVSVTINTTDIVGTTLQAWLKQYMIDNRIFFAEPASTQEFPDFYLDDLQSEKHMLEVKSFNLNATPAFDIANFDSYCSSVKEKPYRLDADYIIFGYVMSEIGEISIKKIWLHKIWEIAGDSGKYALKTQTKRGVIYNIRPNSSFKKDKKGPFKNKDDYLIAIYKTLVAYRGQEFADDWKQELSVNYERYYGIKLPF